MSDVCAIGVDAGSTTCKVVAIDADRRILGSRLEPALALVEEQSKTLVEELAEEQGASKIPPVVATGYGRKLVPDAARAVTEITCHALGVFKEFGKPGTLVDIGGQDSKVIVIGPEGRVVDFSMNDKCAAGTGRFLEHSATRLGVSLEEMAERALATDEEETISSTCTVFAESEIISLVAHGANVDAIMRGLYRSLISRVVAMVSSVGLRPPLMLSGGVAKNEALCRMLGETLGETVNLPSEPQLMGAYGAAILGLSAA